MTPNTQRHPSTFSVASSSCLGDMVANSVTLSWGRN